MEERLIRNSLSKTDLMFSKDTLRSRNKNVGISSINKHNAVSSSSSSILMTSKFRSEYAAYRRNDDVVDDVSLHEGNDDEDVEMNRMEVRERERKKRERSTAIVEYSERKKLKEKQEARIPKTQAQALALRRKMENTIQTPDWHPHWKLMRVVSGHLGWVRCIAVEPGNEWFATGSADRTIKIWDLASGTLKLTLTGHIHTVRALQVSPRHPYMFSASEDKQVMCWDLEANRVIRKYHGHLSGVYCMQLHPTLDLLITGGRDSVARVWDMRTRHEIMTLGGHKSSVSSIIAQGVEPQIVTGSMDSTIRYWDLRKGNSTLTLTHHKKGVRAMCMHPKEYTMASGSADNIKKWLFPKGRLMKNFSGHNTIVNTLSVNDDNVLVSCGDDGSMKFWDWKTGYNFQTLDTIVQPGSMESESAIYASTFDMSGSRFITCEADKSIKIYKEDENSTEESDPVDMKEWTALSRKRKRY